jgi:hypothetical protein
VRIVPIWVAEWSAALPHACYSRRHGDLTLVIPSLSGWADVRTWMMSQEGLERANEGAALEAFSGESETDDVTSGAQARQ